jgi:hypothetical protein
MNNTKENSTNQSERIQAISRKLLPICWIVIACIVAGVIIAGIQFSSEDSTRLLFEALIGSMVFSSLYWIVLILLIMGFLKSCHRDGIFSVSSSKSIGWIGRLILIEAIFKLVVHCGSVAYFYTASSPYISTLISSITSSITKIILGVFLLIVARIITVGIDLEKDAELTI